MNEQQENESRATAAVRERSHSTLEDSFGEFLEKANPEEKLFLAEVMKTWSYSWSRTTTAVPIANAFESEIEQRGEYFRIEDEDLARRVRDLIKGENEPETQKRSEPWTIRKIREQYSTNLPTGRERRGRREKDLGIYSSCGESLTSFTPSLPSAEREFLAFCQALYRATDEDGDRAPDGELLVDLILAYSCRALNPDAVEELVKRFREQFKWRLAAAKSVISEYPYAIGIDVITQSELSVVLYYQNFGKMHPEDAPSVAYLADEIAERIAKGAIVEPGLFAFEKKSRTIVERPALAEQPEEGKAAHA
ncbi:MAG: hypothetical protein JO340_16125 [Acidobacteriaceae bacterium]|nr:hypothetical protein [Acidobacteriaceae bacterium]